MLKLSSFPKPSSENTQTISERNSNLIHRSIDTNECLEDMAFPAFFGSTDKCKLMQNRSSHDPPAFIHTYTPLRVTLLNAWNENGLIGVLSSLTTTHNNEHNNEHDNEQDKSFSNNKERSVSALLKYVLGLYRRLQSPHLNMSSEKIINTYSQVQNWDNSNIRYMEWHPHTDKMAIALKGDELLIKGYDSTLSDVRALRLASQKDIVQLAWRPFSASDLAVACNSCIILWHIQALSLSDNSRSSLTATNQILSKDGHCPITSIAWTPCGDFLISCSPLNRCMLVWNTSMGEAQTIRCTTPDHLVITSFSPDHLKLLTTTTSNSFRVWECKDWGHTSWGGIEGSVSAHAWSPDGLTLLFIPSHQPVVYSLVFLSSNVSSDWLSVTRSPTAVISLAEVEGEDGERIGGRVHQMTWDPNGERLAISFKDSSSGLIAVYQTRFNPLFKALPRGFIRGMPGEKVSLMSFKPYFNPGSLLSIAWSSGRISHLPFYYKPSLVIGQLSSRVTNPSSNQKATIDQLLSFDGQDPFNSSKLTHVNDSLHYRHRGFKQRTETSLVW